MTREQHNAYPLTTAEDVFGWENVGEREPTPQERYAQHRLAYAESIGRPVPDERHAVWPR